MRFLLRELFYVIAALCSIYAVIYLYLQEDRRCQAWIILVAIIITYIAYKVCVLIVRRKNREIRKLADRKKELEIAVLGDDRQSSRYNPDDHIT